MNDSIDQMKQIEVFILRNLKQDLKTISFVFICPFVSRLFYFCETQFDCIVEPRVSPWVRESNKNNLISIKIFGLIWYECIRQKFSIYINVVYDSGVACFWSIFVYGLGTVYGVGYIIVCIANNMLFMWRMKIYERRQNGFMSVYRCEFNGLKCALISVDWNALMRFSLRLIWSQW